ncbi:dTDP-4-dehydrorhamnose 3,5-epimerase family protein [Prochlorothrix hollandica]|uniref:dTDP-4-dehydrorhamnose 3,5-epimerase family protein n=1 Tax=Prochlorothrix hollandica TaxID=1223 RepID=UPI0003450E46|nr:dTDP-4-dehydrorhamnose 3,5-epimerase family protein [Prochlorothrix hollandica]
MAWFEVVSLKLAGSFSLRSQSYRDPRGAFSRWFCPEELKAVWGSRSICQMNYSQTQQAGAVRGLHFQRPPQAEAKVVRCIRGRVWDVAVDLRPQSPTFLQWQGVELAPQGGAQAVLIPEGCAHGFQVLEPDSELFYVHSAAYAPPLEGGVRWDDPRLQISWPLAIADLSDRDRNHPWLEPHDPRTLAMASLRSGVALTPGMAVEDSDHGH